MTRGTGPARTVALDGPAAAGKSTVGRGVADALRYLFFDTGCLYRALTLAALEQGVDVAGGEGTAELGRSLRMEVLAAPDTDTGYTVLLDGRDVTHSLRRPAVEAAVPAVSRHPAVRAALLTRQREVAAAGPVIMVGRDIGTVVLPEADLKLFLVASPSERAVRRLREQLRKGELARYEDVLQEVIRRDESDAGRSVAPMKRADEAVVVGSDDCTLDEVVAHIVTLVRRWPDELTIKGGDAPCAPARMSE